MNTIDLTQYSDEDRQMILEALALLPTRPIQNDNDASNNDAHDNDTSINDAPDNDAYDNNAYDHEHALAEIEAHFGLPYSSTSLNSEPLLKEGKLRNQLHDPVYTEIATRSTGHGPVPKGKLSTKTTSLVRARKHRMQ